MVVAIFGASWEDIGVWRTKPNKFELVISIDSKNYIGRDYGWISLKGLRLMQLKVTIHSNYLFHLFRKILIPYVFLLIF